MIEITTKMAVYNKIQDIMRKATEVDRTPPRAVQNPHGGRIVQIGYITNYEILSAEPFNLILEQEFL